MTSRDKIILLNILDITEEIQSYLDKEKCRDFEDFATNSMLKRAVSMCIITLSEVILGLSDDFQKIHPNINVQQFRQLRNIAAHNYGSVSFSRMWDMVTIDIPQLYDKICAILGIDAHD